MSYADVNGISLADDVAALIGHLGLAQESQVSPGRTAHSRASAVV